MSALRTVRQLTKLRPAQRAARPTVGVARCRGFTVSAPALKSGNKLASSSAMTLLAQKLRAEISYEAEVQQDDVQVGAVPRTSRVSSRRAGGSIRVMLSIVDLQSIPDEDEPEPEATDDEGPARGDQPALRVSVAITKTTHPGALHADLYCAEGAFDVASVAYYKDARIATELSIASDWERRTLWTGPLFESLDPALNDAFETYLRERGVDGALAGFVPRYALWKEQREYLKWLHGVEGFVKA
ncbi:mitochondrial glycoprotein [Mycena albidolilacea]|uniref:Mitochondrial glycoprotein n=1 Tax=Mycena albidolilacea TaxID=1033008 RepID=A0AAD6Z5W6_9AGAR|nr:mitochondrial glycoprotein [Mycena albidolilacea]